jgi:uncharacterized protein (DUF952 family)
VDQKIYKVCGQAEWRRAEQAGCYAGSVDDKRDGYIHFSRAGQLRETLRKYFLSRTDLVVISFDPDELGPGLRYEPSRGGDLFPHLYAELSPRSALSVHELRWRGDEPMLEGIVS